MQFSDTTNKIGLIQECERRCSLGDTGISGNSQLLKEFTARINNASSIIWSKIFQSNGAWQYDDSNQTDLPQSYTDLTSGTALYNLDADALTINRVDVKDSSGNWVRLTPLHQSEIEQGLEEFESANGTPKYYRLLGNTIELFPAPNYNSTGGIKIFFDRDGISFVSTDTSDSPGFASPYHYLLAVKASMDYLVDKNTKQNTIQRMENEWQRGLVDLVEFYSLRFKDFEPRVRPKRYNFR